MLTDYFIKRPVLSLVISTLIGAGSALIGTYGSYYLDGATGGVIVLVQASCFLTAYLFAPKHGRLAAMRRAKRLAESVEQPTAERR